jgi:hypothetical protein
VQRLFLWNIDTVSVSEWTCPTCKKTVGTPFCAQCGENPLPPKDLTLRGLGEKLLHALTNVDGRLIRTLGRLLRWPGTLTVAYVAGQRKPYVAPIQIFLFANVLFFAVQSLSDANIFGATLESHLHNQDWSEVAQSLLTNRLKETHVSQELYAPVFDRAVALNAKTLIILMTVPFTLLLPLAFFDSRQPIAAHFAFSLHLYAFLLLVFTLSLLIGTFDVLLGGSGLTSARMDNILSIFNFLACATYLYFATGPAYGARGAARVFKALLLAIAVAVFFLGYRFILFVITLYWT